MTCSSESLPANDADITPLLMARGKDATTLNSTKAARHHGALRASPCPYHLPVQQKRGRRAASCRPFGFTLLWYGDPRRKLQGVPLVHVLFALEFRERVRHLYHIPPFLSLHWSRFIAAKSTRLIREFVLTCLLALCYTDLMIPPGGYMIIMIH